MRTFIYLLMLALSFMGVQAATIANGVTSRRSADLRGLALRQIHNADYNSGSTTPESHGEHHGEHGHMSRQAAPATLSTSVADGTGNVIYTGDTRRDINSLRFTRQEESSSGALARRQLPDLSDTDPSTLVDTSTLTSTAGSISGLARRQLSDLDDKLSVLTDTSSLTSTVTPSATDATPPADDITPVADGGTLPADDTTPADPMPVSLRGSQPCLDRRQDVDSLRGAAEEDIANGMANGLGARSQDLTPSFNRVSILRRAGSITSSINGDRVIDEKIPSNMNGATEEVSQDLEDMSKGSEDVSMGPDNVPNSSHASPDSFDLSMDPPMLIAKERRANMTALTGMLPQPAQGTIDTVAASAP